jgi:spore germination cell wall hydrolase CwlJ-like protein
LINKNFSSWVIFVLMIAISVMYSDFTTHLDKVAFAAQPPTENSQETQIPDLMDQMNQELGCVATAVYYESRGEPEKGQLAVARVIQNRISANFATTACDVVYQKIDGQCQFTWACENPPAVTPEDCASCWHAARAVFVEHKYQTLVKDALYFHETTVDPNWCNLLLVTKIGHHNFYKKSPKRNKKCK